MFAPAAGNADWAIRLNVFLFHLIGNTIKCNIFILDSLQNNSCRFFRALIVITKAFIAVISL